MANTTTKKVTPLLKPSEKAKGKTSQQKLADEANEQANAPTKAELQAQKKAEALQTKRSDSIEMLKRLLNTDESKNAIARGYYTNDQYPRISAIEDNQSALDEAKAETKKLNEALRLYLQDGKRLDKRNGLETELASYGEFADATEQTRIKAISDNKTAIEALQGAIKTAKNKQAEAEKAKAQEQMNALLHDTDEVDNPNALALLGGETLAVEKFEQSFKTNIARLAENLTALDENGKPVIKTKELIDRLNINAVSDGFKWIQEGLIGMELKRRIVQQYELSGIKGDGFVETVKKMCATGELIGTDGKPRNFVTFQVNTNIVEKFYDYLIGVDTEMILPREHYVSLRTWAKEKTQDELEEFFTNAPVYNDGKPIKLADVKAMVNTGKTEVKLDANAGEITVKATEKISITVFDWMKPHYETMLTEYGSMQAFVEAMFQQEFIAVDAREIDGELSQDEIDEALADFDAETTETETTELDTELDTESDFDDFEV